MTIFYLSINEVEKLKNTSQRPEVSGATEILSAAIETVSLVEESHQLRS